MMNEKNFGIITMDFIASVDGTELIVTEQKADCVSAGKRLALYSKKLAGQK